MRITAALPLALTVVAMLVAGCGGLPPERTPDQPQGSVVVIVVEEGTGKPLTVPAVVIVGGVRGVLNPNDEQVVLRNVPVGTGTPPTQPLTVSAPGYVTRAEAVQVNVTTATWLQIELTPADTSVTGSAQGVVQSFEDGARVVNAFLQFFIEGDPDAEPVSGFTDSNGAFIIRGIPMGANQLVVQAAGFFEHSERVVIIADDDGRTPDLTIELIAGDTRIQVRGRVLDVLTRLPIQGATVVVGEADPVQTDADGRFTVPDVLVGDHELQVTHPDYDPYEVTLTVIPGQADLLIELFERAQQPPGGPYTITGMVTVTGAPDNSGATVTATLVGQGAPLATAVTGPEGTYGLFVPPGRYTVRVSYGGNQISTEVIVPPGGVIVTGVNFAISAT